MKNLILISLTFLLMNINLLYSQSLPNEHWVCGTEGTGDPKQQITIPSIGTLNCLVVFAQFSDESGTNTAWPPTGPSSALMNDYVDESASINSSNYANLTHYFAEMSLDQYHVIGIARSVILPNP